MKLSNKYIQLTLILIFASVIKLNAWVAPILASPANASANWSGLTLDWGAVSNSQFYQLQVDTTPLFNSPVKFNVTKSYINNSGLNGDTQHYIEDLYFGKTYYWRVRAYITNDTSLWVQSNFTTNNFVTTNTPTNSTINWTGLIVDWSSHNGVKFYDLEADTSINFNSPALKTATKAYINTTSINADTQHYLFDTYFGKTYYWRVRARNTVDTTVWSVVKDFKTADFVNLSSPPDGWLNISTAGVLLNWNTHTEVSKYQMQLDTTNAFNSPLLLNVSKTYINNTSINADTEHQTATLLTNRVYYWRVRAINLVDTSSWTGRVFSTGNCVPPLQPSTIEGLSTICGGANNTYSTMAISGATGYVWSLPVGWTGTSTTNTIIVIGNSTGNISVTATNSCGISIPQNFQVNVNTVNTNVTNVGLVLTANAASATYQWIDCNNGNSNISGQTSQTYTATSSGNYAVIVTENGCSDTSACYSVITTEIDIKNFEATIQVFPNPSSTQLRIYVEGNISYPISLTIYSTKGEVILEKEIANAKSFVNHNLTSGIYFYTLGTNQQLLKNGKLIIQK
jgi:hypothetical protein